MKTQTLTQSLEVAGQKVGHAHPCFVIAEAGVNHNGDPKKAFESSSFKRLKRRDW